MLTSPEVPPPPPLPPALPDTWWLAPLPEEPEPPEFEVFVVVRLSIQVTVSVSSTGAWGSNGVVSMPPCKKIKRSIERLICGDTLAARM